MNNQDNIQKSIYDQYEILDHIGHGSYANVFKAFDKKNNKLCAIKIIKKSQFGLNISELERLIYQEVKIMKRIRYKHIIKFYGYETDKDYFYIIMEYAEKGSLANLLKKQITITEKQAKKIFVQILKAVDFLHNQKPKIIHRDIKPENILISRDNVVKLADFGCSQFFNSQLNSYVGTPYYLAPEIVRNQIYNEKVDIWSLGVLLYEITQGKMPFDFQNKISIKPKTFLSRLEIKITLTEPEYQNMSENLKLLLKGLLQKNAKQRLRILDIQQSKWLSNSGAILDQLQKYLVRVKDKIRSKTPLCSQRQIKKTKQKKTNPQTLSQSQRLFKSNQIQIIINIK